MHRLRALHHRLPAAGDGSAFLMLSSERLIIRPFQEGDYQDLYEYLSLKETYRFEPGEPISLEEAKKLCRERARGTDFWAATLKDNSKRLIGHVSFIQTEPKFFLTWEIGFIFNPAFQNKGYATEASRALIEYAFRELSAHRIVGHCTPENVPSWRVLEKCGMKREGLLRKNVFFRKDSNGQPQWLDSYEYAILAEDSLETA
jgi:ribosomal-protein-alanine N-acetyltransferase